MDSASVLTDNHCQLGQWLHGEARSRHGASPAHRECVQAHASFHREAGHVAQHINQGSYAEAKNALGANTRHMARSSGTITAIAKLKKEFAL